MLLSMTGFGEATCTSGSGKASVAVRTVNNRYLKVNIKRDEAYSSLDGDIEKRVRDAVNRGTVNVTIRVGHLDSSTAHQINAAALETYWCRLKNIQRRLRTRNRVELGDLLALPGVVGEGELDPDAGRGDWPLIREALEQAIDAMNGMRTREGQAMGAELLDLAGTIGRHLDEIEARAPAVVEDFRNRLQGRLNVLLAEADIKIDASDILREVSIFAERSDIREEVVRLRSHLDQFGQMLEPDGPAGRKLEFLTQEMFREANTIGSKASDVPISHETVEIKSAIDRMRELVLNIE